MRQMFADPKVEAVSIATPNHWHALAAIWAMKAGKDVYGEKPACYNIYEGMRMIQVQRETKRIMQVGSQHRSWPFKIKAITALQQGLIGKLYMTKALCYKLRPSIGHTPDSPTPPGLNWDLFLGPAPMRPFNEKRFAYYWHWFWDTGNGDIGNQGVHETGIARWALGDPGWPKTAMAFGGKFGIDDDTETPNTLTAGFSYGDQQLVIEVRGRMTNGEGVRQAHVVTAGPGGGRGGRGGRAGSGPRKVRLRIRSGAHAGGTGEQSAQCRCRRPLLWQRRLGRDERPGLPGVQGRFERTDHGRAARPRRRRSHGPPHAEFPGVCEITPGAGSS